MHLAVHVIALTCVLGLTAAPSTEADLTGAWSMTFSTPNGAIDATATFKVDGDKLSGTMSGPAGDVPFTGSVKGDTFTFGFDVQSPNGQLSITINGKQDGDSIKGTFDFGQGMGDWAGKRKN